MAVLRRRRAAQPAAVAVRAIGLPSGKDRRIAGLSFHVAAVKAVTKRQPLDGSGWTLTASLVREPHNEHDANAVGIWVDGQQIGHVNRDDAKTLSPLLAQLESVGYQPTCGCRLWGGHSEDIYGGEVSILAESRLGTWVEREVAARRSPAPFDLTDEP